MTLLSREQYKQMMSSLALDCARLFVGDDMPRGASDDAIRFAMADECRKNMREWYRRPFVPERPASLPDDVPALIRLQQKARHTSKLTNEEKQTARLFAGWRYAVLQSESEAAVRLRMLIWIQDIFVQLGCQEQADEVLAFVRDEWRIDVDPLPGWQDIRAQQKLVYEGRVLPNDLRCGEWPKRGKRPSRLGAIVPGLHGSAGGEESYQDGDAIDPEDFQD